MPCSSSQARRSGGIGKVVDSASSIAGPSIVWPLRTSSIS